MNYQTPLLIIIICVLFTLANRADAMETDLWFYDNLDLELLPYWDTGRECIPIKNTFFI